MYAYEGKVVIPLCHNLISSRRANGPPLAREATAGSPTRRARQSNWSAPTQGPVGLKLAELVSADSLFSFLGVFHFGITALPSYMYDVDACAIARPRKVRRLPA
jgi:hypothetical protein